MWNQGSPLTEYTLRLIGSDIEHYIRKLLFDGEIKYNMNAQVLNFSMGKPRVQFNHDGQPQDVQPQWFDFVKMAGKVTRPTVLGCGDKRLEKLTFFTHPLRKLHQVQYNC